MRETLYVLSAIPLGRDHIQNKLLLKLSHSRASLRKHFKVANFRDPSGAVL